MTEEDKKLIAGYMGLVFNPARLSCYQYEDGREFKFNSNDASRCVKEMEKLGDFIKFIRYADTYSQHKVWPYLIEWLFNAKNFFNAMVAWRKDEK